MNINKKLFSYIICVIASTFIISTVITRYAFSASNIDLNILEQNANNGDPEAQVEIGNLYFEKKLFDKAKSWYEKAAINNNSFAQNRLGNIYHEGIGVTKDLSKATYFYKLSANNGNKFAQYNLGNSYYHGDGCDKDINKALKWLKMSCESGYNKACDDYNYIYKNNNINEDIVVHEVKYNESNKNIPDNKNIKDGLCTYFYKLADPETGYSDEKYIDIVVSKIKETYGDDIYNKENSGISKEFYKLLEDNINQCYKKFGYENVGSGCFSKGLGEGVLIGPINSIVTKMNNDKYEEFKKAEEEKRIAELNRKAEERRRIEFENKKKEKEILKRGCLKILADYNISEEEYDYFIPFSNTFGELLCYGKMGEVINKFSKPSMFTNYYTVDYEFINGSKLQLKFKKEDNTVFEKQAQRRLNTDKPVLNFELSGNGEIIKPKSFDESMMIFINIAQPLIANGIMNIREFEEFFK